MIGVLGEKPVRARKRTQTCSKHIHDVEGSHHYAPPCSLCLSEGESKQTLTENRPRVT